jgi:hypothetical protein
MLSTARFVGILCASTEEFDGRPRLCGPGLFGGMVSLKSALGHTSISTEMPSILHF